MGLGLGFMDFLDDIDNIIADKGRENLVTQVPTSTILLLIPLISLPVSPFPPISNFTPLYIVR